MDWYCLFLSVVKKAIHQFCYFDFFFKKLPSIYELGIEDNWKRKDGLLQQTRTIDSPMSILVKLRIWCIWLSSFPKGLFKIIPITSLPDFSNFCFIKFCFIWLEALIKITQWSRSGLNFLNLYKDILNLKQLPGLCLQTRLIKYIVYSYSI